MSKNIFLFNLKILTFIFPLYLSLVCFIIVLFVISFSDIYMFKLILMQQNARLALLVHLVQNNVPIAVMEMELAIPSAVSAIAYLVTLEADVKKVISLICLII